MALVTDRLQGWVLVAVLLSAAVPLLWLLRGLVRPERWLPLGGLARTRLFVFSLTTLAAAFLAATALNPRLSRSPESANLHLAVAVDVSESVLRAEGGWPQIQREVGDLLSAAVAALPGAVRQQGTASVLTFGSGSLVFEQDIPLDTLPDAFLRLDEKHFAAGGESDLGTGLDRAIGLIEQNSGRGAVLLVSDGNQTVDGALTAASRSSRQGIPIYVYPIESREPALSITAADLPRQVDARSTTYARGLLYNSRSQPVQASFTIEQNPGSDGPFLSGQSTRDEEILPGQWARFRVPLQFSSVGLQFLDMTLIPSDGSVTHHRRFFTHVVQPPRILAIGGDQRWTAAITPGMMEITEITPAQFPGDARPEDFDAVVISSVAATDFAPGALENLAEAVQEDGVGLLLFNGTHTGADPETTKTVLMSYQDTPIDPLLPVTTDPRDIFRQPPTRQVVILIDASGSMSGPRLDMAKQIATYIINQHLRPEDYLDVIAFTTDANHLVDNRAMDDEGKRYAVQQISAVTSGGGTNPSLALRRIAGRRMSHCGLIFISDGEFAADTVSTRPDCRATVFAINTVPPAHLAQLADPIPVGSSFNPANITIPYFEPERRDKFFEPGGYTPLTAEFFSEQTDRLPVPGLSLEGTAVTTLKDDGTLVAVRPRIVDPVLAYMGSGAGYVGAFTTGLPDAWISDPEGQEALETWIMRTIPYAARDRYDFRLIDHGSAIEMTISLVSDVGGLPDVSALKAQIEIEGQLYDVKLERDPAVPAVFSGLIALPREVPVQQAVLVLEESGPEALSRPQRIPFLLPGSSTLDGVFSTESFSYGLNEGLLREIAQLSGGQYNRAPLFHAQPDERQSISLWPWLALAALIFYLLAVLVHRLDP